MDFFAFILDFFFKILYQILLILMNEGLGTPLNFVSKVSASLSSPHPDPVDQICPLREGVTGDGEGTLDAQQNHLGSFKSSPMA